MDLAAVEKAAQVMPVFVRNENADAPTAQLTRGCYGCTEHNRRLGSRGVYATVVVYAPSDFGEFDDPRFGFTVAIGDDSFREMDRYHWLRYLIAGNLGVASAWTSYTNIEENPTFFVRLFNGFDGQGVQHKHARVNVFEYIEDLEPGDLWAAVFEPHYNRPGIYVDPVEELLQGRNWELEDINRFVHMSRNVDAERHIGYYWRNVKPNRLKQLRAGDEIPEVAPGDAVNYIRENEALRNLEREALRHAERQRVRRLNNIILDNPRPTARIVYRDNAGTDAF